MPFMFIICPATSIKLTFQIAQISEHCRPVIELMHNSGLRQQHKLVIVFISE